MVGGDGAELAQPAQWRRRDHQVVRQLVERPLDAEIRAKGQREHERVGRHVAAAVVADQQHRAFGGNPVQARDIGPEIQRRQQPRSWQLVADIVGIPLIEVGFGDSRHDLLAGPVHDVAQGAHKGLYTQVPPGSNAVEAGGVIAGDQVDHPHRVGFAPVAALDEAAQTSMNTVAPQCGTEVVQFRGTVAVRALVHECGGTLQNRGAASIESA